MNHAELLDLLFAEQDLSYRDMQIRIIPNIDQSRIIGVRTPQLRLLASSIQEGEWPYFSPPHRYFEEEQVYAFLISSGKNFSKTIQLVDEFLPFVDNWATCDQMSPKIFRKHRAELLPYIEKWIHSKHTYAVRFAIKMLMDHFLEDSFLPEYPQMVAAIRSEEYYIRMMTAWYFATALAKQYPAICPYLQEQRLEKWVHNKTIQKAVESYRITPEQKERLKLLRI